MGIKTYEIPSFALVKALREKRTRVNWWIKLKNFLKSLIQKNS